MATEQGSWFESTRSALCAGWRIAMLGQDQRHAANLLEAKRIGRDRKAAERMHETLAHAKDWQEVAAACQSVVGEYFASTADLWQEETALMARAQSEFNALIRETVSEWDTACANALNGIPSLAIKPVRAADWFYAFDRALAAPTGSEPAAATAPAKSTRNADAREHTR